MSFVNFIDFNTDKDTAISIRTSPIIQFHKFNGVQLIPNNSLPYIQSTNVSGGIELEDWTAYVVDSCTEIETDITDYFSVDRIFQDTNGQAQFDWSITNVPVDFGSNLVYLKVIQGIGETFYSNVFQFTSNNEEKTCRLDYKNKEDDTMQSTQVQMYYWQDLKQTEINSYYEVSTRNTVTTLVKSQKFQRWATDFLPNFIMIKIDEVFENKYVYVDLVRTNLFEAIEIQEFSEEENFKSNIIKLSQIGSDVYDPLYTNPIIISNPSITLNSVIANGINSIYNFSYDNFSPTSLVFQRSQDQVNWINTTLGVTSPQIISFNGFGDWSFRIIHPIASSNIITLNLGSTVVANNDKFKVKRGETIDIDALFNDVLVGDTIITNVSTANNGTASIIESGTKIRYIHNGSLSTSDTFTYTISNGISTDTGSISMLITEAFEDKSSVLISINGSESKSSSCLLFLETEKYFDGEGLEPNVFDIIYEEVNNSLILFNGQNLWYAIENGKTIQINTVGRVIDVQLC